MNLLFQAAQQARLIRERQELIFWTTAGPTTTFDPKITGGAGTWFFDDGTTIAAASGAEISKTFATDGLHRAVFRPTSGGLAGITAINMDNDSAVFDISQLRRCLNLTSFGANTWIGTTNLIGFLSALNNGKLTSLVIGGCSGVTGDLADISSNPLITLNLTLTGSLTGSLTSLRNTLQTVYMHGKTGVVAASIAHLVDMRDFRIYSMGWFTADVDLVLLSIANAIVADAAHFTYATPVINIGGTNEAPSGIYQAPTGPGGTPTSGLEAVWIMAHNTGHTWVVTFTGGVANELLLGNVAGTGEKSWAEIGALNTRTYAQRFVATSGSLSDLKIKVSGNTNMKMAVYTDVAGDPGTLLAASDEFSAVSGWNKVTLNTVCDLATGSYYWITFKPSVSSVVYYNATGGAMSYKDTTYADAFTADFGAHSDTTVDLAVGGYGLKVV